jgi:cell division protein FtsZ
MTQEDYKNPSAVAKIKVIGVGGAGGNAVNTMIKSALTEVDFICCNTDVQALKFSLATKRIQIGKELTRGLGAGADPDVGREAAIEDKEEIANTLAGADMVFITAGMGGGTGTGAAAIVAQTAREMGALTVAVVTKPFNFEGKRRRRHAEAGIQRLRESVDTLITIPNQRLLMLGQDDLSMVDAFKMADAVLVNAVQGISDIINIPGILNVDFADVKTVMSSMGQALMGIGRSKGPKRALDAAKMAICSPLLEDVDIEGATGILINITAGNDVKLHEIRSACEVVQNAAHEDAQIIFGAVIDESLGDELKVTVIATGFPVDKDDDIENASEQKLKKIAQFRNEPVFSEFLKEAQSLRESKPAIASSLAKNDSKIELPIVSDDRNEAQELAIWTFNHIDEDITKANQSNKIEEKNNNNDVSPINSFCESVDLVEDSSVLLSNETEYNSNSIATNGDESRNEEFVSSYAAAVSEVIKGKNITDTTLLHEEQEAERENAVKVVEGATKYELAGFQTSPVDPKLNIEEKIDEALALSERLRFFQNESGIDELDIPTFLRSNDNLHHS